MNNKISQVKVSLLSMPHMYRTYRGLKLRYSDLCCNGVNININININRKHKSKSIQYLSIQNGTSVTKYIKNKLK